jgi:nitrate reductase NapAB chaperone NapD
MPVCGLVVTFSGAAATRGAAREIIEANPEATVGASQGDRLPIVLEAASRADMRRHLRWLEEIPGVSTVSVVFATVDDLLPIGPDQRDRV